VHLLLFLEKTQNSYTSWVGWHQPPTTIHQPEAQAKLIIMILALALVLIFIKNKNKFCTVV
jgi:hypothetical protein